MALCSCMSPLVACGALGDGSGAVTGGEATSGAARTAASTAPVSPRLVPAPAVFEASGTALWDGGRTVQGVWVAHPQTRIARRVRIYNTATGAAVDGALFGREATLTGPSMLVSSDAAGLLGMTPGEETELRVVAVAPDDAGETETLAAAVHAAPPSAAPPSAAPPSAVPAAAAPPPAAPPPAAPPPAAPPTAAPPTAAPSSASPAIAASRRAVRPATPGPALATAAAVPSPGEPGVAESSSDADEPVPAAVIPVTEAAAGAAADAAAGAAARAAGALAQPYVQAGVFAVAGNAEDLVRRFEAAGIPATGKPVRLATGPATRVLAGPYETAAERDAARARIRSMGLRDAVPVAR